MRGIFFSEDDARLVERTLLADGYEVSTERVDYAGEDDDADHPWAVSTDAPAIALEILVDRFDGWLDDDAPQTPPVPPLRLPAAPKRHHNPPPDRS